jgi:hypothetical protein
MILMMRRSTPDAAPVRALHGSGVGRRIGGRGGRTRRDP